MLSGLADGLTRRRSEDGFTLVELLVVIIIIGILFMILIPSFMKYRDLANKSAAQANVRAAIPAVREYFADNNTYAGMTLRRLQTTYDRDVEDVVIQSATARTYCIESSVGEETWKKSGPDAEIVAGACP